MRNEKKILVGEIERHLDKSTYAFFTDFRGVTVADVAELRRGLRGELGEFHVVKKKLLKKAAANRNLPLPPEGFEGQLAIVVGGENPAGIAKVLKVFFEKSKEEKLAVRGGLLGGKMLSPADVNTLAELPGIDVLRGQLLALFNAPATRLVRTLGAAPQGMLNVLSARAHG
jgi:large subunit ribosomal protein L10